MFANILLRLRDKELAQPATTQRRRYDQRSKQGIRSMDFDADQRDRCVRGSGMENVPMCASVRSAAGNPALTSRRIAPESAGARLIAPTYASICQAALVRLLALGAFTGLHSVAHVLPIQQLSVR